ncbi:hypothetical protein BJ944DRAFT_261605 [Cunninghamella echinulata]|nr:hypothetical protein BJ944DRAFT_261605 [Cunninghamella echinulata]
MMNHIHYILLNGTTTGILLDQVKTYDWVHPEYLQKPLNHMRFLQTLFDTLSSLFFNTKNYLSINGCLAKLIV